MVHVVDSEELLKLQGNTDIDPKAFADEGTYAVLVLDKPTKVTGMVADGSGPDTREAKILGIGEYSSYGNDVVVEYGDLDQWKQLDGNNVVITAVVDDIWFPTDVSLPIGEPRLNKCTLLGD